MSDSSYPDIFIVGLGISGYTQVTRETEQALAVSKKVFFVHTEPYIRDYLSRFCQDVEDLYSLYSYDHNRAVTYDAMANKVMEAASQTPPVTFALYGHPLCFVTPSKTVLREAPKRGLRVEMMPGVSALDTLFVDLSFDPATMGLIQFEANHCLMFRPKLDPTVPCLIWQPGAVETRGYNPGRSKPQRFFRLRDYLLEFYPARHKIAFATSASNPLVDPEVIWTEVGSFPEIASSITGISTMYIPAAEVPVLKDPEFVRLLDDPTHVASLVESRATT